MTDEERQIKDAFMRDFEDLLRRYNASFNLTQSSIGGDAIADIDFNAIYDEGHNLVRPYINLVLPNYLNPN
jgi:hypothetical protein